jgi:septin family protein
MTTISCDLADFLSSILVIGTRNSGKTSFLDFLKTALALPAKKRGRPEPDHASDHPPQSSGSSVNATFSSHYLETEIDGERIGLTLWDSHGMEKNVVDLQLREMNSFLESKFEDTFTEEMKVIRAPGVRDTHIHCVFLVLDPVRLDANIAAATAARNGVALNGNGNYTTAKTNIIGALDEDLDLQVLKSLQGKTTVVPVISKADTITTAHMAYLKRMVWDSLKQANLDPLEALGLDDFEGSGSNRSSNLDEQDEDDDEDTDSVKKQGLKNADEIPSGDDELHELPESRSTPTKVKRSSSGSINKRISDPTNTNGNGDSSIPYLPLSIISPDIYDPGVIGRKFPWGFADPYNVEHCDFVRLKEAVFSEWRGELREASRELWYEGWRTSRLRRRDTNTPKTTRGY